MMMLGFSQALQHSTTLKPTGKMFKNGQMVWHVNYQGDTVGQFWPIKGLNLVTRQTDSLLFTQQASIAEIQALLNGVATAPDGMSVGSLGSYTMQGKSLSNGRPCGDGVTYNYGVVVADKGFTIHFTHNLECNLDSLYEEVKARQGTLFYLPSVYRNGTANPSKGNGIEQVLVRREVPVCAENPDGIQMGVIRFNKLVTYAEAQAIITGLDISKKKGSVITPVSTTTHIYVLDGGSKWGQACIETNGVVQTVGSRDPAVITNYLVLY